jgi:hypothetical protein
MEQKILLGMCDTFRIVMTPLPSPMRTPIIPTICSTPKKKDPVAYTQGYDMREAQNPKS